MADPVRIDARGMRCPWPAIRLARALREGTGVVEMIADDPAAPAELAAVAAAAGARIETAGDETFRVTVLNSPSAGTSE